MIITLCGSTRFKQQFDDANFWLTMNDIIVLSVGSFLHSDNDIEIQDIILEHKAQLDALHKRKIEMSDAIMVIDIPLDLRPERQIYAPEGYIGISTLSEIKTAICYGKPTYSYTESKRKFADLRYLVLKRYVI